MDLQMNVKEVCPKCQSEYTKHDFEKHLRGGCLLKHKAKHLVQCSSVYTAKSVQCSSESTKKSVPSTVCEICQKDFSNVPDFLKHVRTGCTVRMSSSLPKVSNKLKHQKVKSKIHWIDLSVYLKNKKNGNIDVGQKKVDTNIVKAEIVDKERCDVMNKTTNMSGTKLEVTNINPDGTESLQSRQVREETGDRINMDIDSNDFTKEIDASVVKTEIMDREMVDVIDKNDFMSDTKLEETDIMSVASNSASLIPIGNETFESRKVRKKTDAVNKMIIDASYYPGNISNVVSNAKEEQVNQTKPMKKKPERKYTCKICQDEFDNVSDFLKHKRNGCRICKICKKEFDVSDFLKHIRKGCSNTSIEISENDHKKYSESPIQKEANKFLKSSSNIAYIKPPYRKHIQVNSTAKNLQNLSDLIVNEIIDNSGTGQKKVGMGVVKTKIVYKEICDVSKPTNMFDTMLDVTDNSLVGNETLESREVRKQTDNLKNMVIEASDSSEKISEIALNTGVAQVNQDKPVKMKPKTKYSICNMWKEKCDKVSDSLKDNKCSIHVCKICKKAFDVSDFLTHVRKGCSNTRIKMNEIDNAEHSSVVSLNSVMQEAANICYNSSTNITNINSTYQNQPQVNNNVKHLQILPDCIEKGNSDSSDHREKEEDITYASHEEVDNLDIGSVNVAYNDANVTDIKSVSNETSDTCDVRNETDMTTEMLVVSNSPVEVCTIATSAFDNCDKVFDEGNVIILKPKGKYISFDCSVCDKKFSNGLVLKKHLQWHKNGNPRLICKNAVEVNTQKRVSKRKHLHLHQKRKYFECNICKVSFARLYSLTEHRAHIHNEYLPKSFVCPTCGKMCSRKDNFKAHLNTHSKNKLHLCEICGRIFKHYVSLYVHKRKHSGYTYFKCDTCNRFITTYPALKKHIQMHVGYDWDNLPKCPHCSKRFTTKSAIRDHLNIHTGARPHICVVCRKSFAARSSMKQHWNNFHSKK